MLANTRKYMVPRSILVTYAYLADMSENFARSEENLRLMDASRKRFDVGAVF